MATTTTNFGWDIPQSTDLVKDGATAIAALGQDIDTALVDLKGGTTGQVLAKASATDLDYSWVTTDDTNAIQNAIVDAKGDLIAASAADVPARLAVGNNGESLLADSSTATGLRYQGIQGAGKNILINSDFSVNQRNSGTITTSTQYPVDRFSLTFTGGSCSATQNTFTPGTNPSGLTVKNYITMVTSGQSATTDFSRLRGAFEDVYTFAGETVTFSFYAKAASGTPKVVWMVTQNFGTGGSTSVDTRLGEATLTTSWARYSITATMPSISGKTIGAGNFNTMQFFVSAGSGVSGGAINLGIQNNTFDIAAWQLEAGSVATPFQTATGTKQGELAACQRYYYKTYEQSVAPGATTNFAGARVINFSTAATTRFGVTYPTMRVAPTITVYNPETGSTASLRTDIGTNLTLNGPFAIGQTGGFVDTLPASTGYGSFHLVAISEL